MSLSCLSGPRCELAEFKAFRSVGFGSRLRLGVTVKLGSRSALPQIRQRFNSTIYFFLCSARNCLFASTLIYWTVLTGTKYCSEESKHLPEGACAAAFLRSQSLFLAKLVLKTYALPHNHQVAATEHFITLIL